MPRSGRVVHDNAVYNILDSKHDKRTFLGNKRLFYANEGLDDIIAKNRHMLNVRKNHK